MLVRQLALEYWKQEELHFHMLIILGTNHKGLHTIVPSILNQMWKHICHINEEETGHFNEWGTN